MMNRRQFLATSAAAALVPPEMPRPMVGLYSMLTPDQKAAALNVAWDESFGPFASGRSERASEAIIQAQVESLSANMVWTWH